MTTSNLKIQQAVALVQLGLSFCAAARASGASTFGVGRACRRLGIVSTGKAGRPKQPQPQPGTRTSQALVLVAEGVSPKEVARQVGISHQAIYAARKRYLVRAKNHTCVPGVPVV